MKKHFLFISCEEALQICDKAQYGEATSFEKFKLKLRLSWCHITKSYSKKNVDLTQKITSAKIDCLSLTEKDNLKSVFENELAKHK